MESAPVTGPTQRLLLLLLFTFSLSLLNFASVLLLLSLSLSLSSFLPVPLSYSSSYVASITRQSLSLSLGSPSFSILSLFLSLTHSFLLLQHLAPRFRLAWPRLVVEPCLYQLPLFSFTPPPPFPLILSTHFSLPCHILPCRRFNLRIS